MDLSSPLVNSGWRRDKELTGHSPEVLQSNSNGGENPSPMDFQHHNTEYPNSATEGHITRAITMTEASALLLNIDDRLPRHSKISGDNKAVSCQQVEDSRVVAGSQSLNCTSYISDIQESLFCSLRVRQHPIVARACGFRDRDRRTIDPPPILEMRVQDPSNSTQWHAARTSDDYCVVHCTLWDPVNDTDCTVIPATVDKQQQRRLLGTLVSSPFYGKDEFDVYGCFFPFPDLSVRTVGKYCLRFQLFVLKASDIGVPGSSSSVQSVIKSSSFSVLTAKEFPRMAATALTKTLKHQGSWISVNRSIRAKILERDKYGDQSRVPDSNPIGFAGIAIPLKKSSLLEGSGSKEWAGIQEGSVWSNFPGPVKSFEKCSTKKTASSVSDEDEESDGYSSAKQQKETRLSSFVSHTTNSTTQLASRLQSNFPPSKTESIFSKDDAILEHDPGVSSMDVFGISGTHLESRSSGSMGLLQTPTLSPDAKAMPTHITKEVGSGCGREWLANMQEYAGTAPETSSTTFKSSTIAQESSVSRREYPRDDDEEDDGGHRSDGGELPPARLSTSIRTTPSTKFACPYRKHNPGKYTHYNRQWRSCALSPLSDVARVKGHLYRTHRIYKCERCSEVFTTFAMLKSHFLAVVPCGLSLPVTVDGVTCDIEKKLKSRKKVSQIQTQENRWAEIYRLLFPDVSMMEVPSPYFEPIHDDTSLSLSHPFDLSTYQAFSQFELPTLFDAALQAKFSTNSNLIDSHLRAQLVEMVQECQAQVIASFVSRSVIPGTNISTSVASRATATPNVTPTESPRQPRQFKPVRQRRSERRKAQGRPLASNTEAVAYPTCLEGESNEIQRPPSARGLNQPIFDSFDAGTYSPQSDSGFNAPFECHAAPVEAYQSSYYPVESADSSRISNFTTLDQSFEASIQDPHEVLGIHESERADWDMSFS